MQEQKRSENCVLSRMLYFCRGERGSIVSDCASCLSLEIEIILKETSPFIFKVNSCLTTDFLGSRSMPTVLAFSVCPICTQLKEDCWFVQM